MPAKQLIDSKTVVTSLVSALIGALGTGVVFVAYKTAEYTAFRAVAAATSKDVQTIRDNATRSEEQLKALATAYKSAESAAFKKVGEEAAKEVKSIGDNAVRAEEQARLLKERQDKSKIYIDTIEGLKTEAEKSLAVVQSLAKGSTADVVSKLGSDGQFMERLLNRAKHDEIKIQVFRDQWIAFGNGEPKHPELIRLPKDGPNVVEQPVPFKIAGEIKEFGDEVLAAWIAPTGNFYEGTLPFRNIFVERLGKKSIQVGGAGRVDSSAFFDIFVIYREKQALKP